MKDILIIADCLILLGAFGFTFYGLFCRLRRNIRRERAEAMREAYQARKAAVERQARQRLWGKRPCSRPTPH